MVGTATMFSRRLSVFNDLVQAWSGDVFTKYSVVPIPLGLKE